MASRVRLTDVAPRDGLQNEPSPIPAREKVRLVRSLANTGVDEIEVSSFVSPRWVPQLADAREVFELLAPSAGPDWPVLSALVPNEQGLDAALAVNDRAGARLIGKVSVFTAASETFSRRNTNATIAETLARFRPVIARARRAGLEVRGYVSCAVACPFEGRMEPRRVAQVGQALSDLGATEIDLGDTIGAAEPGDITLLLAAVGDIMGRNGLGTITLHLHDTFGRAGECVREALGLGVTSFDASSGGLGGCPFASTPGRRAPGNIDMLRLFDIVTESGFSCGATRPALAEAARVATEILGAARGGEA
ncbi:MAG: hydroxymethylglutaryl-CoA lyase [Phycisphaerales bacterium]|nr:hydroxymethylglutaryl-CoA lyase [Phycisphaerales bacterium]